MVLELYSSPSVYVEDVSRSGNRLDSSLRPLGRELQKVSDPDSRSWNNEPSV